MKEYIEREAFLAEQRHLYCENCARRKNGKGKFVYEIGDAPCRACDIGDVLDAVEDFHAADVRPVEWIPVSERLPEHGWYLAYGPTIKMEVLHFHSVEEVWSSERYYNIEVTHWMPLPEPYREERTEE